MATRHWITATALGALLLGGCTASDGDAGPPDALECDVIYRAGEGAEPEQATIRVERQIGQEGNTDSVTFGQQTDAEMTVSVSYHASSAAHGLVQAWVTADGDEIDRQIVEFEDEYPGGPERPEDQGNRAVVTYVCDAAD
ncbi:hypothetical protein [Georgenia sunbinii]|uniref:hypothetical protein n=1 Tax=Georgenia sunbinii TaxID=3117728 RepID=UPI002F26DE6C